MSCRVVHRGQLSDCFNVRTGVCQGCLLSPFMFLLVIDWIMRTTTEGKKNGVQRTPWTQLEDLDYADDLALLSHSHDQKQGKTTRLAATSERTRLKINRGKSKVMRFNTTNENPITVGGEQLEEVDIHTLVVLYHTIPYHTIPYHTIPYHTIPYHTIPYHTIPYVVHIPW